MGRLIRGGMNFWIVIVALVLTTAPVWAQEKPEQKEEKIVNLCAGCLAPIFTEEGKGSIKPYGRIDLEGIYSTGNTNPLDPPQFNGYGTAAGTSSNSSSTLNPRYSVFGIRADRTDGTRVLTGVVEADFYGETDTGNNLLPRLRLAYLKYSPNNNKTSFTIGQDWNPIMGLLPDLIDFSIMGYGGNLWNRIPQITLRHNFTENIEGLFTVMRFERGLSNCCGRQQVQPSSSGSVGGGATNAIAFNDPVKMPYFGTRLAYNGTGNLQGTMAAINVAYRYYRSAPIPAIAGSGNPNQGQGGAVGFTSGRDINSYVVGGELVHQITPRLKFMGELAWGQALGNEWFRWNQDLNLTTGAPVRAWTGWFELSYAYSKHYTFIGGWGFDNPLDRDLSGSITTANFGAGAVNSNIQYLSNNRTHLTAIRQVWSDLYVGFEWNHFWTKWAGPAGFSQPSNEADMYNVFTYFNF